MPIPERRVRAMLATVREAALADNLPATLVACLHDVVGADHVHYNEFRPEGSTNLAEPAGTPETNAAFALFGHQHPALPYHRGRPAAPAVRLSDVTTQRRLRSLELWAHVMRPLGISHQINVPLYESGPRFVGAGISRSVRDFSDADLAAIDLLRVDLSTIIADRERRARDPLAWAGLTSREAEVLSWLATGMRDADIARELGISTRTVSKHLEAVYRKLGVSSRAGAAAIAGRAANRRGD